MRGQHRGPLLKKREKGRTPSCFTSTIQETRATLPALIGPSRQLAVSSQLRDGHASTDVWSSTFKCTSGPALTALSRLSDRKLSSGVLPLRIFSRNLTAAEDASRASTFCP